MATFKLEHPAPMLRFTIRDVLWLTVVVALGVALWIEHRRFNEANAALHELQAEHRLADLRAKELRGEVILPAGPEVQLRALERRGWERPRAIDDP
jgi:hypothetical protein